MMNPYLVEQNSEARRAAMIDAALTDSPRFWLSRTLACLLMTPVRLGSPVSTSPRPSARPARTVHHS